MMISRTLIVLLFFLNLNNTRAWDGCGNYVAWRCGDTCINGYTEYEALCKCGGEIFNKTAQMWCCNDKPCEGRGGNSKYNTWYGEKDKEGRLIGAECNGTALKLEEPCNEKCNDHEKDPNRNYQGLVRSFRECNVSNIKTTQCIREDKYLDGDLDCRNRADEEIFQTNTSLILLDLGQILRPCKDSDGRQGFKCSGLGSKVDDGWSYCLLLRHWCNHNWETHKCTELANTTATGKTTDPMMCGNQTFWERKSCNEHYEHYEFYHRCTGDTPGQCVDGDIYWYNSKCLDGSSEIKEAKDGHCDGEEVMCTARYGSKWMDQKVCVKDQYRCDRVDHCEDGEQLHSGTNFMVSWQ